MVNESVTSINAAESVPLAKSADHEQLHKRRTYRWLKLLCGVASVAGFGYGIRAAINQARPLRPGELPKAAVLPAAGISGMAMQALGLATLITVSGYISLLVLISETMGVNNFKEFGSKTTALFGDRFRISKGVGETYITLDSLFEAAQRQSQHDKK